MTAAEHNKTLATLWFIYGAIHGLTVVGLLLLVFVAKLVTPLALALAVISLLNIPVGTALGIYTFKFLKSEGGVRLYGGKDSVTSEIELQDALHGAQPLADLAKRVRR